MRKVYILLCLIIIIAIGLVGYLAFQYYFSEKQVACTMEAKICPDGSFVGRTGPNCEFTSCPSSIVYRNEEFGFELTFPTTWQGYSVEKQNWQGWRVDGSGKIGDYSGIEFVFNNPKDQKDIPEGEGLKIAEHWQNIPIMVLTPDVWQLVQEGKVSVNAAPIGPSKIGQNSKYIFATPPRWYGFTDAIGWQEAVDIVKTFKVY